MMFFITDATRQVRISALKSLGIILLRDSVKDVSLVSRLSSCLHSCPSSPTMPIPFGAQTDDPYSYPTVLISNCTALTGHVLFHERLVQFFLLLAGACWSPTLTAGTLDPLFNISFDIKEKEENVRLSTYLSFIPYILSEKYLESSTSTSTSTSNQPLFTNPLQALGTVSKNAMRETTINEISYHVITLLRTLSNIKIWSKAIAAVLVRTLSAARISLSASSVLTSPLSQLEMLGTSILLGDSVGGPFLGSAAHSYHNIKQCHILSVHKSMNLAIILSLSNNQNFKQVSTVHLNELSNFPIPLTMKLSFDVVCSVIDVLDSLTGFVDIAVSDFISLHQPGDPFFRNHILHLLRPIEIFIFHQFLRALINSEKNINFATIILKNKTNLFNFLLHACSRSITSYNNTPSFNHEFYNISQYENEISKIWMNSSRYITILPKKTMKTAYPDLDHEKKIAAHMAKSIGIRYVKGHEKVNENLLRKGMITELIIYHSNDMVNDDYDDNNDNKNDNKNNNSNNNYDNDNNNNNDNDNSSSGNDNGNDDDNNSNNDDDDDNHNNKNKDMNNNNNNKNNNDNINDDNKNMNNNINDDNNNNHDNNNNNNNNSDNNNNNNNNNNNDDNKNMNNDNNDDNDIPESDKYSEISKFNGTKDILVSDWNSTTSLNYENNFNMSTNSNTIMNSNTNNSLAVSNLSFNHFLSSIEFISSEDILAISETFKLVQYLRNVIITNSRLLLINFHDIIDKKAFSSFTMSKKILLWCSLSSINPSLSSTSSFSPSSSFPPLSSTTPLLLKSSEANLFNRSLENNVNESEEEKIIKKGLKTGKFIEDVKVNNNKGYTSNIKNSNDNTNNDKNHNKNIYKNDDENDNKNINENDNKNILQNIMTQELFKDCIEVTKSLAISLSLSSLSLKFDGTRAAFHVFSNILVKFYSCTELWLNLFKNHQMENEICYHIIRILLLPLLQMKDMEHGSLILKVH